MSETLDLGDKLFTNTDEEWRSMPPDVQRVRAKMGNGEPFMYAIFVRPQPHNHYALPELGKVPDGQVLGFTSWERTNGWHTLNRLGSEWEDPTNP